MPALGHTMEAGTVREWLRAVGDPVGRGEAVAVVESDKAAVELEAPAAGVLLEIRVAEGTEVAVGTVIGVIGPASAGAGAAAAEVLAEAAEGPVRSAAAPAGGGPPADAVARRRAAKADRPRVTPIARVIALREGLDPDALARSRPDRPLRKADVLRAAAERATADRATTAGGTSRTIPLSGRRRIIAERMRVAWRDQPMVTLHRRADVTALTDWRKGRDAAPTVTALLAAAFARALREHPAFNARIDDAGLTSSDTVDLAVAVALDDGVVAPVLRGADVLPAGEIAARLRRLADAAGAGRLAPGDLGDGTATLSNLGAMEIEAFTPILTPGQAAVLGVGAVDRVMRELPVGFGFRSEIHLSLTFDHRAADGADGARLLAAVAALLQDPDALAAPPTETERR